MTRIIAAILLILLAIARGVGGVILILRGAAVVDSDLIGFGTARLLGSGLVIVSLLALAAAYGLIRRKSWGSGLALAAPVIFVLDGVLNGYMLFGQPGDRGTIINVVAALVIIAVVILARIKNKAEKPA